MTLPRDNKTNLTAEILRKWMRYEPETGKFYSLETTNQWPVGREVGSIARRSGYRRIGVMGEKYLAHRLVWLYMTGAWPREHVDHKDGNRANNKWNNLREANAVQNMVNAKIRKTSALGVKGVRLHESGKFQARLGVGNQRTKHLGLFHTIEAAIAAYRRAALERHGEFARFE